MLEPEMNYTNDELVERIWDKENVLQVINRHSYYISNEMRREELLDIWVKREENRRTASLGYNNGFYTGMDEISRHYVKEREAQRFAALEPYSAAGAALEQENLGLGCAAMHTSTTPLVYIADDGKSARYQGYRLGFVSTGSPDGSAKTYLDFGLIRAELLKEDGQWKLWHLVLEHDHTVETATHYAQVPVYLKPGDDPLEAAFGEPTIKRTINDPFFGWEYMWQDMPKPYYTYTESDSYGPEGVLGKPYYERERR